MNRKNKRIEKGQLCIAIPVESQAFIQQLAQPFQEIARK
ncbi:hypothetical protein RV02_GL002753 [Enterococcus gilvus]|nr:hypothetical protein RV02_GL002753 [Enterococcus gilvus]